MTVEEKREELVAEVVRLRQEQGANAKTVRAIKRSKTAYYSQNGNRGKYTPAFNGNKASCAFRKNACRSTTGERTKKLII